MQDKQASKGKPGKAANKEDRKPKEGNAVSDAVPKNSKTKGRAARRAAGKISTEAPTNQEESLAQGQDTQSLFSGDFTQPMFIQPGGVNTEYSRRFELPPQVHHDLLESSGFLAPLRVTDSTPVSDPIAKGRASDQAPILPPPGIPQGMGSTDSMDFNIIPDYYAQQNALQKLQSSYEGKKVVSGRNQEIDKLAESIKSLSEQLTTLQQCIAHQHQQKKGIQAPGRSHNSTNASLGNSDSTKSGSDYNGSSPPSTPGSEKHKNRAQDQLHQLTEFSRELQWALGAKMNLIGNLGNPELLARAQQMQQQQQRQQQVQWFGQL